jgi:hypothetical protein
MNDVEKAKLKDYIDELRAEMHYWSISLEANNAIEDVLQKIKDEFEL